MPYLYVLNVRVFSTKKKIVINIKNGLPKKIHLKYLHQKGSGGDTFGFYDFDTFTNSNGKNFGEKPQKFPNEIKFYNLLSNHDYFQIYVPCKLENAYQYVMPNQPFYITNDENDNLFYLVKPKDYLTRIDLAFEIINWLMIRNAYYNLKSYRKNNKDIDNIGIGDYASNLSVHGLKYSGNKRKDRLIYHINLSS